MPLNNNHPCRLTKLSNYNVLAAEQREIRLQPGKNNGGSSITVLLKTEVKVLKNNDNNNNFDFQKNLFLILKRKSQQGVGEKL